MNYREESVLIVDAENRELGAVPRSEMRRRNLIHRAAYILVFNFRGELFVHKRTMGKDMYPGHYDIAAGGVVLAGESYEESAYRELAEELGVIGTELNVHSDIYFEDAANRVWGRVFTCVHDGPLTLQVEEVESGAFLSLDDVVALTSHKPFTPDSLVLLQRISGV